MIWKKDRLAPTQPYLVFDTHDFYQEIYLQQGISHFYSFHIEEQIPLRIVPDGCIDLFFEYEKNEMYGYVCGTTLKYSCEESRGRNQVFGIRFMPGVQPELIGSSMREVLGQKIPIEEVVKGDQDWVRRLEEEEDFYQRIRVFLEAYTKAEKRKEKPYGKKELVWSVKQMVYHSDGKIRVEEMQERSGYSARYINRTFLEEMGFSPKTFCKIIQFQRALELRCTGQNDRCSRGTWIL